MMNKHLHHLEEHHGPHTGILEIVAQVSHLLPSQGPIKVFVHHNTLHAFEHQPFEEGVKTGLEVYGCEPYLSEQRYRDELRRGRIRLADLEAVLMDDLGEDADHLVASFGTRYSLRLAMLQFPMEILPDRELQWVLAESDMLTKFREQADPLVVQKIISETRRSVTAEVARGQSSTASTAFALSDYPLANSDRWTESTWEAYTLNLLWQICRQGVLSLDPSHLATVDADLSRLRHRDLLVRITGTDPDSLVHDLLIRFSAAFLDQGFASWELPDRESGFLKSFSTLFRDGLTVTPLWMEGVREELKQLEQQGWDAVQSIEHSLARLGVSRERWESYLTQSLLALRGWAGMMWQMESSAPWTPRPAPKGTLVEFLAVRLLLDCQATAYVASRSLGLRDLKVVREESLRRLQARPLSRDSCAFAIFQIAQVRGFLPEQLRHLSPAQWQQLVHEILAFSPLERRRVMHLAYERAYRNAALDAVITHSASRREQLTTPRRSAPAFQVITCIDDREESFRRHLEEVAPDCETYGAAGFFAVVMYYRGAAEAHYRPLCPINVVPKHYVVEEPVFSAMDEGQKRSQRRRLIGQVSQQVHASSRTMLGGLITGVFGSLATFPLVARILAPHITARIRDSFGGFVRPPATELRLEREATEPGPEVNALGYTYKEMAGIVVRILQDIGLVKNFSPIVLFLGHGSSSLNNPHESAYNCGACSGGRGGPNARAFAWMANHPRVRGLVAESGITIPENVRFIGGYHNTCSDRVEYYDLDQLPHSLRPLFRTLESNITEARKRNALERARRFESAPLSLSPAEALKHVEERTEDLSQARPEFNHATNALCFVGRRAWSRALFLDRRAFLASYDPSIDDASGKIIERILQAAIPVCGGISLEYYFSTVDSEGYGCGSKLPHNITALAGVMTGAASDLRPGLSAQMVEIHEPMRILFVVETTIPIMTRIIAANPAIQQLVQGRWVQLALLDAERSQVLLYQDGAFVPYQANVTEIPTCLNSIDWFRGRRDNLAFASIQGVSSTDSHTDAGATR